MGEGFLHLLPVPIPPAGMTVESMVASMLPWGAPALWGIVGTDSGGTPLLIIGYEWPIPWARAVAPIERRHLELLQLERFRSDHIFGLQEVPFLDIGDGADPPDFVVTTSRGTSGIECTSFAVAGRREALALFGRVRSALLGRPRMELAHLSGFIVYIWFGGEGSLDRPFRRTDDQAGENLIRALCDYRPHLSQMRVEGASLPEQAPNPRVVRTASGASFYGMPLLLTAPSTILFALLGFEVGLAFSTTHTPESVWEEISRLINDHDQPGVDVLLVSVGAPNRHGQVFPSDEAVARFAIEHPRQLAVPSNIGRVTMHFWGTGEAWDLVPHFGRVFGPLYQGTTPAHQPLVPERTESASGEQPTSEE